MPQLLGWLRGPANSARLLSRIAVVSPHLDDAVFSVGAAVAAAVRGGADARIVTVLAGDVDSTAPAGSWDARAGFRTEGEAAIARRAEDEHACRMLGAHPIWLPFGDVQYERGGTEDDVYSALVDALAEVPTVLLPGYPVRHADHVWLRDLIERRGLAGHAILPYVEQPYTAIAGRPARAGDVELLYAELRDRVVKIRASRAYRSQVRLLGYRQLWQTATYEMVRGGEAILTGGLETA